MVTSVKVSWDPKVRKTLTSCPKKRQSVLAFIQARTGSTRFPRKIYENLNGAPLLFHTIARAKEARLIDDAVVCSPEPLDVPDGILNYAYTSGNESDVLERFYYCLQRIPCDYVVRLTADCPLLDPNLIDFVVEAGLSAGADYCSNVVKLTFPDGVDCELISGNMLGFLHQNIKAPYHREHVTSILRDSPELQEQFNIVSVENEEDHSRLKWSIDTPEDLARLRSMEAELFK